MSANNMMRIIGEELNNGFFKAVSDKFDIDCEKLSEFFTEYFVIDEGLPTSSNQKPRSRSTSKTPKKTEEKSKPKRKPSGKNELPRNEQSEIKFSDIANFTVANLITYNRERGLITSGNKAALKEPLEKYEIEHGNGPEEEQIDEGQVAEKKQKGKGKKKDVKVKISVDPEVLHVKLDEYGRAIAYDDLVCEKDEYGEYIVCGTVYEDGKVGKLTAEHIEKCKLNNIKYNIDNFAA
jgi:hypothetical protein